MRPPRAGASALILLVATMLLSGCVDNGGGNDDGPRGTGGSTPDPTDTAPTPSTSPTPDDSVPAPADQYEDDPDDIDKPGEYALLPRRTPHTNESMNVPAWSNGQWWRYEHTVTAAFDCKPQTRDEVDGTETMHNVSVYRIETVEHDCDGNETGTKNQAYTRGDLVLMDDDGYIEHNHVFPLQDGKRWRYMRESGVLVDVEASHEPDYLFRGASVEAWHFELVLDADGNVTIKEWFGVEAKNVLRKEIWADSAEGVATLVFATELVARGGG